MKNYLFELSKHNGKVVEEITKQHFYYKVYNDFLEKFHLTNVEENEDFIPYIVTDKALMILRTDLDVEDLEFEVFDLLECFV